ncbi:hypothetical protein JOC86_000226 [Bacillus pakistanensis]|uniref:Uncharacterized protein n=1 Tax=Rossellomorea pakistanensis TaxID=992288 RepID=A0ABS2N784_9BACI|nr:hypothetical protein [Bacillus pakistanensis]MBM7583689.1 hypothetical protein [Bacillus pakistanensis]
MEAAEKLGVYVTTSAPFNLGKIIEEGYDVKDYLVKIVNTKGILSTMVGMKRVEKVRENLSCIC